MNALECRRRVLVKVLDDRDDSVRPPGSPYPAGSSDKVAELVEHQEVLVAVAGSHWKRKESIFMVSHFDLENWNGG